MKREIETELDAIEREIASKKELVCKDLAETIRIIKKKHPEEIQEIFKRIQALLAKYNVDCITYLRGY